MALTETRYEHIVTNDDGVPSIAGTTMKIVELIAAQTAYGWSAEELQFQFPSLTLGQIHSALAYYWDHQDELDRDLARRVARAEEWHRHAASTPLHDRLRTQGLA